MPSNLSRELLEALPHLSDDEFFQLITLSRGITPGEDFDRLLLDVSIVRWLARGPLPFRTRALCAQLLTQTNTPHSKLLFTLRRVVLENIYQCELTACEFPTQQLAIHPDLFELSRLAALGVGDEFQTFVGWLRESFVLNMHQAMFRDAAMSLTCLLKWDLRFSHIYRSAYKHLHFVTRTLGADEISTELFLVSMALEEIK